MRGNNARRAGATRANLTAPAIATGSINTRPLRLARLDGLGAISPRTFGEAQIDFDALTGGDRTTARRSASAYLKSRSSDSFTAALKDFIAPVPLNLDNCGTVIIRKQTVPDEDPNATLFGYTKSFTTNPALPSNTFTLADDGVFQNNDVLQGTGYTVVEDVIPTGWAFTSLDCSASSGVTPTIVGAQVTFAIDSGTDVLDCTYTNTLQEGAILIHKDRKHADSATGELPHAGVTFTLTGGNLRRWPDRDDQCAGQPVLRQPAHQRGRWNLHRHRDGADRLPRHQHEPAEWHRRRRWRLRQCHGGQLREHAAHGHHRDGQQPDSGWHVFGHHLRLD